LKYGALQEGVDLKCGGRERRRSNHFAGQRALQYFLAVPLSPLVPVPQLLWLIPDKSKK
jgi:hypothetical protein